MLPSIEIHFADNPESKELSIKYGFKNRFFFIFHMIVFLSFIDHKTVKLKTI